LTTQDARDLAVIAVIAVAPLALCVIIALLRGYTIHLSMDRTGQRRWGRRNDDDN